MKRSKFFSIIKAKDAINDSHVVILVLDAHEGVTEQDATLLGLIADKGRALLIVINKWDGLDDYQKSEVKRKLDIKLSFVNYATVHYISALHGSGVGKLFSPIKRSYENAGGRFSYLTSKSNIRTGQQHTSTSSSCWKENEAKVCQSI